ncbi:MAG: response regulator transcription factor [Ramlibacter sp.]|nr:response regulator transcription factor [Ramlibacter sp.]
MRVLVVEDDRGIAEGLQANLRLQGWAIDVMTGVAAAWSALGTEPFDIVLLDLELVDGDGTELLRRIRRAPAGQLPDPLIPVLIMTARDKTASRIAGLDLGADDYVTKPFDVDELAARMRALRRRAAGRANPGISHGALRLDPAALAATFDGRPIELSTREFAVLLALVEASPRVLSRLQIEAKLYNWDSALDSNAIEVHVHHLRRKLGENIIRTVRGVGYFIPREPA